MPHVAVDGCRIRPIRLDGNDAKAVLRDQLPRDCRPGPVEFRGAMARFTTSTIR
jgi:hypothetical protein